MTIYELKYNIENIAKNQYFFSRRTMSFFGDTLKNFGVTDNGDSWLVYRKSPVKHGIQGHFYFDKITYKQVYNQGGV